MGLQNGEVIDIDLSVTARKRFRIDGDNDRILELNTSDTSIVGRLQETYPKLQELAQKAASMIELDESGEVADLSSVADVLKETDAQMREYIDYIFDADVSAKCAPDGYMWDPFNGKFRFEHIIETIGNLYGQNYTSEFNRLSSRVKKHTDKYLTQ